MRDEVEMPGSFAALWRTFRIAGRAEPGLLALALGLALLMMLPDALLALWLKLMVDGVIDADEGRRTTIVVASLGLAASVTATWYLGILSQRVQRRFRDRVAIVLEAHVAQLQASVPTIEHHERPEYLDRLEMLREQVFTLDHMFLSLFSTLGWMFRLAVTIVLLGSVHPLLMVLPLFAAPALATSTWRPAVERRVEEAVVVHRRLARHLFVLGTSAPPGKEVRVTGTGDRLVDGRREAWQRWYDPVAAARRATAAWHSVSWAAFGLGYVGAIVYVAAGLDRGAGDVVLVVAAGTRLAAYIGGTAGELGFLRGFWLDGSRRLVWLEAYAARAHGTPTAPAPDRIDDAIVFDHVSFRYPGSDRLVLDDVSLRLPAGAVIAIVGENGAGKTTLVKLLARMYAPTAGVITVDGVDLQAMPIDAWRTRLAGAFQDFSRFEFPAQRTVGLGDLPRLDDRPAAPRGTRAPR
jgi:ATP-binding cassette subfamily B protein